MRSAMARFLTVNDFSGSPPVPRGNQDFNLDSEQAAADSDFGVEPDSYGVEPASYGVSTTRDGGISTTGKNRNDQGPCLYFGPQGQRCSRPAISNGFCARHVPVQLGQSAPQRAALPTTGRKPRIAALGLAALVIFDYLWPIISEVFREIIRLIHAH
jgi:hypothetical protein